MKRALSAILCVLLSLSQVIGTASGSSFLQNPDLIEEAIKSVLFIVILDEDDEITATGSGFVAFNSKTIVTNHHVIDGADSIWASDEDDNVYEIDRILAVDEEKDIALLLMKSATSLTPLKLADNPTLKRGQPILTIGSPEGLKNSVSNGIVSAIYDRNDTPDIQFTAPISHGSSGGALFNDAGEVVGITSAFYTEGQNINFAVGIYHVVDLYRKQNLSNELGEKIVKSTISVPSATPELPIPVNVSAEMIGNTALVSWSETMGVPGYRIYRSSFANGTYTLIGGSGLWIYYDKTVLEGKTYYYKVATTDGKMTSDMSDYATLSVPRSASSPSIKPTQTLWPTPKPAPTSKPTPYAEPEYPLKIGGFANVGTVSDPSLDPDVINISDVLAVDWFTFTYYSTDTNDELLFFDDTGGYYSEYTYTVTINPGQTTRPGEVSLSLYGDKVKQVNAAISAIHTTDGRTYTIPESEWEFSGWEMD